VRLEVHDDGRGVPPGGPSREGVGTSNTRHRLRHQYGSAASFVLTPREGGGTSAFIEIPGPPGIQDED
jgi:LytS/YehU family sensor histidine kinase